MKDKELHYHISYFLTAYLGGERGMSQSTFISYNYTFKLLIPFLCKHLKKPVNKIDLSEFNADNIRAFLTELEKSGCSVSI